MAKDKERKTAYDYYVKLGLNAKDIAAKGLATEKTIGNWINKYGWKEQRNAKTNSTRERLDRINQVTDRITKQRINLFQEIEEAKEAGDQNLAAKLQKEAVQIDDAISKWNKRVENLEKEGRISLTVYLEIMDRIFNALQVHSPELFLKTLDFQEEHLNDISLKL